MVTEWDRKVIRNRKGGRPEHNINSYLERSPLVCAYLRARARNVTFVDVLACSVVDELEAGAAITIESGPSVDTQLRAASIVQFAFITSTLVDRLVLGVGAVLDLVAYLRQSNAHPSAAIKLRFAVACSLGGG